MKSSAFVYCTAEYIIVYTYYYNVYPFIMGYEMQSICVRKLNNGLGLKFLKIRFI